MIGTGNDGIRIWVVTTPVDMRKSFDGLMEVVRSFLGHDLPVQDASRTFLFGAKAGSACGERA